MKSKKTISPNSNTPYLITILSAFMIGIVGTALFLYLRPESDFIIVSGVVFGIVGMLTTNVLTFMKTNEGTKQSRETHILFNSRMDELMRKATALAHAEGVQEGQDNANLRTDALKSEEKK